jgi:hypothetical protein
MSPSRPRKGLRRLLKLIPWVVVPIAGLLYLVSINDRPATEDPGRAADSVREGDHGPPGATAGDTPALASEEGLRHGGASAARGSGTAATPGALDEAAGDGAAAPLAMGADAGSPSATPASDSSAASAPRPQARIAPEDPVQAGPAAASGRAPPTVSTEEAEAFARAVLSEPTTDAEPARPEPGAAPAPASAASAPAQPESGSAAGSSSGPVRP